MSQGKRVNKDTTDDEFSCSDKQPNQPIKLKKTAKKRGRINVNACYRCRRDKKKCDGNYSTKESCKYCRHHKVECSYPEPGRRRVKIAQPNVEDIKPKVRETKKIKKVDTRNNPMKDIHERMIKVEENLFGVTELLANVRQSNIKETTQQLFFRLFFDESTTIEQTVLLRKLWALIDKNMSYPNGEEYLCALYKKLELLESDQEEIRSNIWVEFQDYVDMNNNTGDICENEISSHASLIATFTPEIVPSYTSTSLNVSKTSTIQPQPLSLEFDNNHYFEKLSYENICRPRHNLNVQTTVQVINNPLIVQTKSLPIVPSQRSPHIQVKLLKDDDNDRNLKQIDYQESDEFMRNEDSFTFNNCHFTSSNSIPYIESSPTFTTNLPDKLNNETEYFQHLTNKVTEFPCFRSAMSSPLFPSENCGTPTFNSLQQSPSLHPLNEVEHLYGMKSPTSSTTTDYIDEEIVLRTIEQYPIYPTSSL